MKQKLLLLLFIFFSIIVQAQSPDANGVFYVKKNVTGGTSSGNSWANAIQELATALKQARDLNATTPGRVKQIWVAGGTYYPLYRADTWAGPTTTDRNNSFVLLNNVKVYGGFAGTETVLTARNLGIAANKSILSGNLNNIAIATDNAYHVIISTGEVGTAELNGFSIVEGNANGSSILVNSFFVNHSFGGGMCITNSRPELSNLKITNNIGQSCGGIVFNHSIASTNINISNSVISGNVASQSSGIKVEYMTLSLINCTVSGNRGDFSIRLSGGSVSLNNSVVSGNDNGVNLNSGVLNRRNSLVQGFPADAVNFNLDGGLDPKFINAPNFATAPFATGNYNLQSDSPLIDKGNNAYLQANQTTDIAGKPRTINGIVDIGAYESNIIPLTITTSKTDVACYQGTDGAANATVVTGTAPYTYSWNTTPVQSTATATNLTAGTYTVTVTDAANNQATGTVTITEPAEIIVTVTGNETCEGSTATLTASGADDYNWYATASEVAPIATGAVFTTPALSATATYYVEGGAQLATLQTTFVGGTGQNGNMFNVTAASDIIISGFDIKPNTSGNNTIEIYYRAGGYQGFAQTPGAWTLLGTTTIAVPIAQISTSISVGNLALPAGQTYGLYITSSNGSLSYTEGSTNYTDGTLTITSGTGNAYPFGVVFNPRIWNGRIHYNLAPVCTSPRIPVTITVNPPAVLNIVGTHVTCNGANNGEAIVTATGTGPFSYSWNTVPVQNTATATGLAPGTYTVTVTDANGCEATESITITEPDVLVASINSFTNATCYGTVDGEAAATVVGGTAPFSYSWNTVPVQNTATATGLAPGTYTVTVTDANDCDASESIAITEPAEIIVTVTGNESEICEGSTATLTASGADDYNWYATASEVAPIATGAVFTTPALSATATYFVEGEKNVTVLSQPATLQTTFVGGTGQSGNMFNVTAASDIVISGFDINPLNSGNQIIEVYYKAGGYQGFEETPGAWTLLGSTTITAAGGVPTSISVGNLDLPAGQTYGLYITMTGSHNLNYTEGLATYTDGTLTIISGTGNEYPFGFVYSPRIWNGRIHYKKAAVCTSPRIPVTITVNPPAVLAIVGNDVTCNGANNGEATVTATGAGPFSYSWNTVPVQNTATASGLAPGTYTVTVTDANGCEATESRTITEPDVLVASINSFTNATCTGTPDGEATATVVGGTAPFSYSWNTVPVQNTITATSLVDGNYTVTVTDANGCEAIASITINVEDTVSPTVITQDFTVQLDALGNATIAVSDIDNGSSDNCSIDAMILDMTDFDCTNLGNNTVTLTVTDNNGNSSTATAIVTVEDVINPTVITQDFTVQLDASGNATIAVSDIDNGSSDNCAIDTLVLDVVSFDCTNLGTNTVTLTATDSSGNISTGTAIVTVVDAINPIVVTQDITVYLDASGTATITASDIDNGSSDNCAITTLALDVLSFDCTNLGPNTVILTATDSSGNISTGTATVTVVNNLAPTIVTQDITVALNSSGTANIIATDIVVNSGSNCGVQSIVLDVTDFDCTNLGANTVTVTVTDNNGNASTATAIVTVQDTINPTVITQDFTVQLDASGNATIAVSDIDNGSSDNCAIDSLVLDVVSFDCTNLGTNTVTVTATDFSGNTSTGTAIVTVVDAINPTVVTQDITVYLDASGTATITASEIDNGSSDNCAITTLALDVLSFDCTNLGPNTVILTATDSSGNISTGTATVTVVNNLAPTIVTQDITVPLNSSGTANIVSNDIVVSAGSNCGVQSIVLDVTDFDCTNLGPNTVTVTVTDNNGNSSTATAIVTVEDTISPTVITQDFTVQLDASGNATIAVSDIDNGSSDNCAIDTLVLDVVSFDCTNLGPNTVTLTATDSSGNISTGTAIVTVVDNLGPVITSQPAIINLDADGVATLTVQDVVVNVIDNCGVASTELSETDFDCSEIGNNTIVITATDINGNISQQSVSVTVQDTISPVAITQDIQVSLSQNGTFTLTPAMIDNGSTDNCSIASMSLNITNFSCSQIGDNTVILTVTDTFGNTNTATAIVTVLPIPEPTVSNLTQEFCAIDEPIVADIAIDDTLVQWFANATGGNPLSNTAVLSSGTYYVATKYGNCYSSRVAVNIIVKDPPAPTGDALQYICREQEFTIASLLTNEEEILWYDSPSGGTPLNGSTVLEHQQKYYASQIIGDCESTNRLEVEVEIRYCDVVIYNSVSANSDGKNDYFKIEGISYFPDNTVEIFNQWGQIVYKTSRYGEASGNYFKGIANTGIGISGNGQTLLPFGTYYYVIQFLNHDKQRMQKTGYLHLNH